MGRCRVAHAQTFSSPSGKPQHQYTTAPGQLPVDPNYHDDRIAVGGNWTVPFTRVDQVTVGGKVSAEDDFFSATVNASIAHDFNEKNTTLSFGIDNEYDSIHPIGGAPVPGSDYALAEKQTGGKTKDGVGLLLGVTQVMTRNWLSEFNISVDRFTGYLNDPYKFTSIINSAGGTTGYEYESRPDQRIRKSAYWENRVAWSSRISTALSLRYMSDDWRVTIGHCAAASALVVVQSGSLYRTHHPLVSSNGGGFLHAVHFVHGEADHGLRVIGLPPGCISCHHLRREIRAEASGSRQSRRIGIQHPGGVLSADIGCADAGARGSARARSVSGCQGGSGPNWMAVLEY